MASNNSNDILLAGGKWYSGVTLPADSTPLALVAGAPATGTYLGYTRSGKISIESTLKEIMVDQARGPVDFRPINERFDMEINIMQSDATLWQTFIQGATAISSATSAGFSYGRGNVLYVNGLVVVAKMVGTPVRYVVGMGYKLVPTGTQEITMERENETVYAISLKGVDVGTRADGDGFGQVTIYTTP